MREGIPYSLNEARLVVDQPMDPYHCELLRWLVREVELLKQAIASLPPTYQDDVTDFMASHRIKDA